MKVTIQTKPDNIPPPQTNPTVFQRPYNRLYCPGNTAGFEEPTEHFKNGCHLYSGMILFQRACSATDEAFFLGSTR